MRFLYGERKLHKPHNESTPLLLLCEHQDKKAVKKDWIEDLVVNYTMKAIMNDEVMGRLIDTLMELQKKESTGIPYLWVSGVFMKKADKKRGKIFMPRSVYILFRFSQTKYVKYMPKLHTLSIYLNLWRI